MNSIKEIDKIVALITSEYLEGINNIPKEPIKGNKIKVDNIFELNMIVKK
jgi:ABC-type lipoprotein release transport system permease subunit